MARIDLSVESKVPEAAETLQAIEAAFGRVPNLFRAYAHHPPLLRANWGKVQCVMGEGRLDRRLKEAIALSVSGDNGCAYCVAAHGRALKALGTTDSTVESLVNQNGEGLPEGFDERELALLRLVRKSNRSPMQVTDEELEAVHHAGWSDGELVEALGVMELFIGFNRFLDTLQIDIDF